MGGDQPEMSDELSHGEIQELLGAYALGAVDERERALIEAHRETCESCRSELDEHRRLAEALRRHAPRLSPLASIATNGSARTSTPVARVGAGRRWPVPVATAIVIVGASYVVDSTVPRLADGETYQLWRVDNQGASAAATLGRQPDTIAFALPSGVTGFLLTVETDPAPSRPTLPAVANGRTSP